MPVLACVLYGSRARGDVSPSSDTDLLMITDEETILHKNNGKLSISFYPLKNLFQRAKSGDLFLCHVLREGKLLYDSDGAFDALKSNFQLRKSYSDVRHHASDVAWMILKFLDSLQRSPILGRRFAWCVRTLLIAHSAEIQNPVFSARELAQLAPEFNVLEMIAQKENNTLSTSLMCEVQDFLFRFGFPDPCPGAVNEDEFVLRFEETGNTLGLGFLNSFSKDDTGYV